MVNGHVDIVIYKVLFVPIYHKIHFIAKQNGGLLWIIVSGKIFGTIKHWIN